MASAVRKSSRRRVSPAQFIALSMSFVLLCITGGVATAGLAVPLALSANTATDEVQEVFNELPADISPGQLSEASHLFYSDGVTPLATIYAENRIVRPLDQIALIMQQAVIAIEDERFYDHGAVDLEGISRAAVSNLMDDGQQGASTLTQQFVKNVLIDQAVQNGDPYGAYLATETSAGRKAREAKLSIALEESWSKDQILEGYLNIAQFGRSVYGVETAAQMYFNKSAAELNYLEAATIAGITKDPSRNDPTANPGEAEKRRNVVLNKMEELGYISVAERDQGKATPIAQTLNVQKPTVGCQAAGNAAAFCSYALKFITNSPAFGETAGERKALLYRGGLNIVTSLNPAMQNAAAEHAAGAVPPTDPSALEAVITTVEPGTGYVRSMAQNRPYTPNLEALGDSAPPGATSMNYAVKFSQGGTTGFQPGSTWKAFTLTQWLKDGHTIHQMVNGNKQTYIPRRDFHTSCKKENLDRIPYGPGNSDGSSAKGPVSVLKATADSINTAYVNMETQIDLCELGTTAWEAGFRGANTLRSDSADGPSSVDIRASMTLGTQETSPLDMAAAYATFASGGTYCEPIPIERVTTGRGDTIPVPTNCDTEAVPSNVANTVTYALKSVLTQGSAKKTGGLVGRPSAGKSGTANTNTQTWFIGYTPQLSTAVWIGNAEFLSPMQSIRINGKFERYWYGSTLAAPTWKSYMDQALAGAPALEFGPPDPALIGGKSGPAPKQKTPEPQTPDTGSND